MIDQQNMLQAVRKHKTESHQLIPLIEISHLSLQFRQYGKGLREKRIHAITNFDMTIHQGEVTAVVGASGSGKSLLANAILGILPKNAELDGKLIFEGKELTKKKQIQMRGSEIFLIPQSVNALDPLMKAGKQVQAVIKKSEKKAIQQEIFQKLGLPLSAGDRYPFELSGGMARRVLVSMAMASEAKLIIADEPTPGLDKDARDETIALIQQLADTGKGVMFITHDMDAALRIADKVAVFYAGETVEIASSEDFSGEGEKLRHPYTKALWEALPQNDFTPLSGSQPVSGKTSAGCVFAPRCPIATDLCKEKRPAARKVDGGSVRCFHA